MFNPDGVRQEPDGDPQGVPPPAEVAPVVEGEKPFDYKVEEQVIETQLAVRKAKFDAAVAKYFGETMPDAKGVKHPNMQYYNAKLGYAKETAAKCPAGEEPTFTDPLEGTAFKLDERMQDMEKEHEDAISELDARDEANILQKVRNFHSDVLTREAAVENRGVDLEARFKGYENEWQNTLVESLGDRGDVYGAGHDPNWVREKAMNYFKIKLGYAQEAVKKNEKLDRKSKLFLALNEIRKDLNTIKERLVGAPKVEQPPVKGEKTVDEEIDAI